MRHIDLFCGIGSFSIAFRELGWDCVLACDICPEARETYRRNFGMEPLGDIRDIHEIPRADIITAGFPCQAFSYAGKRRGFEDERGDMFAEIMRFVRGSTPRFVILENVPGLLTHDEGRSFLRVRRDLEAEGYTVKHQVLLCSDYGIPQMRRRLIVTACLRGSDAIDLDMTRTRAPDLGNFLQQPLTKGVAYTVRCGGRRSPVDSRHNWDGYYTKSGGVYRLTLRDAHQLQGIPDDFVLAGNKTSQWKMLGNTIPTPFTRAVGAGILACLRVTTQ